MRGYTIDRNHSPCNLNPNGVSCQCHHQLYKSGSKTQRQDKKCRFSVTWKYVRKGHFCNGCTQVSICALMRATRKAIFDEYTQQTFEQRMRTRYEANPGCAQHIVWMHATSLIHELAWICQWIFSLSEQRRATDFVQTGLRRTTNTSLHCDNTCTRLTMLAIVSVAKKFLHHCIGVHARVYVHFLWWVWRALKQVF